MELPHLGKHCNKLECNKLDFLPVACDSCDEIFCSEHFNYSNHSCPGAYRKDVQVPVCPMCGEPVPTPRGETADRTVGEHIDRYCKSDTKKIFTNRCTYKNCKKKELIPVNCTICKQNFCLRHRHTIDHECKGPQSSQETQRSLAAKAAENRKEVRKKPTTLFPLNSARTSSSSTSSASRQPVRPTSFQTSIQGNMSEDEALARALALSIMELDESADRDRRNQQQQLNSPVPPVGGGQNGNSTKDKCSLS